MDVNQPGRGRGRGQIAAIFIQNGLLLDNPAGRVRGGGLPLAMPAGPGLPLDNLAGRGHGQRRANLAEPVQYRANYGAYGRGFPGRPRPDPQEQTTLECVQINETTESDTERELLKTMKLGFARNARRPIGMGKADGLKLIDRWTDEDEHPEYYVDVFIGPVRGTLNEKLQIQVAKICEIKNPDLFYIQLEDKSGLAALEKDMLRWYSWCRREPDDSDKLDILWKGTSVHLGGFYAVYTKETERWHRACILSSLKNAKTPKYVAQLLDYGKHVIVKTEDVQPLRLPYLLLPTQVCVGRLAYECISYEVLYRDPTKSCQTWTPEDIQKFKDDCLMKSLKFLIVESDKLDKKKLFRSVTVCINRVYTLGGKLSIPIDFF